MKHAVRAKVTDGKRLGFVFECVRRRFRTLIADGKSLAIFHQDKIGVGAILVYGARLDNAGDTQMTRVGLVAHGP